MTNGAFSNVGSVLMTLNFNMLPGGHYTPFSMMTIPYEVFSAEFSYLC